mmetsp:Transcript_10716/g.23594  ORF Transcript_10716/g.23594 Transcript_10716/m.23594 type:complete len:81 (+) Transcript_10716:720-962(+)
MGQSPRYFCYEQRGIFLLSFCKERRRSTSRGSKETFAATTWSFSGSLGQKQHAQTSTFGSWSKVCRRCRRRLIGFTRCKN